MMEAPSRIRLSEEDKIRIFRTSNEKPPDEIRQSSRSREKSKPDLTTRKSGSESLETSLSPEKDYYISDWQKESSDSDDESVDPNQEHRFFKDSVWSPLIDGEPRVVSQGDFRCDLGNSIVAILPFYKVPDIYKNLFPKNASSKSIEREHSDTQFAHLVVVRGTVIDIFNRKVTSHSDNDDKKHDKNDEDDWNLSDIPREIRQSKSTSPKSSNTEYVNGLETSKEDIKSAEKTTVLRKTPDSESSSQSNKTIGLKTIFKSGGDCLSDVTNNLICEYNAPLSKTCQTCIVSYRMLLDFDFRLTASEVQEMKELIQKHTLLPHDYDLDFSRSVKPKMQTRSKQIRKRNPQQKSHQEPDPNGRVYDTITISYRYLSGTWSSCLKSLPENRRLLDSKELMTYFQRKVRKYNLWSGTLVKCNDPYPNTSLSSDSTSPRKNKKEPRDNKIEFVVLDHFSPSPLEVRFIVKCKTTPDRMLFLTKTTDAEIRSDYRNTNLYTLDPTGELVEETSHPSLDLLTAIRNDLHSMFQSLKVYIVRKSLCSNDDISSSLYEDKMGHVTYVSGKPPMKWKIPSDDFNPKSNYVSNSDVSQMESHWQPSSLKSNWDSSRSSPSLKHNSPKTTDRDASLGRRDKSTPSLNLSESTSNQSKGNKSTSSESTGHESKSNKWTGSESKGNKWTGNESKTTGKEMAGNEKTGKELAGNEPKKTGSEPKRTLTESGNDSSETSDSEDQYGITRRGLSYTGISLISYVRALAYPEGSFPTESTSYVFFHSKDYHELILDHNKDDFLDYVPISDKTRLFRNPIPKETILALPFVCDREPFKGKLNLKWFYPTVQFRLLHLFIVSRGQHSHFKSSDYQDPKPQSRRLRTEWKETWSTLRKHFQDEILSLLDLFLFGTDKKNPTLNTEFTQAYLKRKFWWVSSL